MQPPTNPRIYHITHMSNVASIVADNCLLSDAAVVARGGPSTGIGMSNVKETRLKTPVKCHPGDMVGDYVPFYFCPRSVMLYVISRANHPALAYTGGQDPIVHLEADLLEVIAWADTAGVRWAFTTSNARAAYADFYASVPDLSQIDWNAVAATDWHLVKEAKQAEFLVHGRFPWSLVRRIGVRRPDIQAQVQAAIAGTSHQPPVTVQPGWYY